VPPPTRRIAKSQVAAKVYEFTLTLVGTGGLTIELADAVYAICDDAFIASNGPTVTVAFDREAESLGDAIGSAVKDIERAGYAVARVEVKASED